MKDVEVIAALTKRSLILETKLAEAIEEQDRVTSLAADLRNYLEDIGRLINYQGHHANLVSVLKDKLK